MKCPKCQAEMEKVSVNSVEIDRCTSCQGIWFDMLEDHQLLAKAAEIDIGDASVGAQYNLIDRIRCPVCPNTPMIRMVDNHQPHIRFESCPSCYGRFFDAGEFRDLAEFSLSDLVKDFMAQERR